MNALQGKVAIVSGSGRGIGREIALKLAREGASVVVNDLDEEPAKQTVEEIVTAGGAAVVCAGSVTEPGFAERFVTTAADEFGGLDIIVNNAGFTWDSVVQKISDDQWNAILEVHLTAPFRILRAAQPVLAASARAEREVGEVRCRKVVNISSISGLAGTPGQANYSAAKAGLVGLTKALSKEWGRYNITVNTVAFGLITTRLTSAPDGSLIDVDGTAVPVGMNPALAQAAKDRIPLGRAGTPQEAAGAVYLFCGPDSDYVTGQTLLCSGGAG